MDPALWCRFEITNEPTFIMQAIFSGLLVITGIIILYSAIQSLRRNKFRHTMMIYIILFLWLFCFMAKNIVGIAAYQMYMQDGAHDLKQQDEYTLKILSAISDSLDRLTTFFLITLMIKIPYLWLKNILKALKQTESSSFTSNDRIFIHRSFKILEFLKKYIYIRNIQLLLLGSSYLIVVGDQLMCGIQIYLSIGPFILEAFLLIFTYMFGHFFLRRLNLYIHAQQASLTKIKNQYMALSISSVVRIVFIVLLNVSQPDEFDYIAAPNCVSINNAEIISRTIGLPIALILCHLGPAFLIIYIYSQSPRRQSLTRSLLDNNTNSMLQYENTSNKSNID